MTADCITPPFFSEFQGVKKASEASQMTPAFEGAWEDRLEHWQAWSRWEALLHGSAPHDFNEQVQKLAKANAGLWALPKHAIRGRFSGSARNSPAIEFDWHSPSCLGLCLSVLKSYASGWGNAFLETVQQERLDQPALLLRSSLDPKEEAWSGATVAMSPMLLKAETHWETVARRRLGLGLLPTLAEIESHELSSRVEALVGLLDGQDFPVDLRLPFWNQTPKQTLEALLLDPRTRNGMGPFLILTWHYAQQATPSAPVLAALTEFEKVLPTPNPLFSALHKRLSAQWLQARLEDTLPTIDPSARKSPRF